MAPKAGVYATVGHCSVCKAPMVSKHAWEIGIRREGHVSKGAGDLCRKHYMRKRRHGSTERKVPKPTSEQAVSRAVGRAFWSREELLTEYDMIRNSVSDVREAAERIGIGFKALDKALYRARRSGDERAVLPQQQVERALEFGHTHLAA